jgi:hypothetical protein
MCSMSVHCIIQNTNHQQMHKESFTINRNTLLHVSTLLGHLQGELFLPLHEGCTLYLSENVLLTVYWRRELSAVRACTARVQARTAESSVHSQQHILTQLQL